MYKFTEIRELTKKSRYTSLQKSGSYLKRVSIETKIPQKYYDNTIEAILIIMKIH